ncbi:MAG TPA: Asp23/Gls24 family envelope stress response protein [Candidatus Corynebacterium gallistercoris]|uniref:Asp23/Gls24 family envelope stress response protein n=1 Tax=Candidatus Corynebacterium gallistercoris TaxID=2838530 RepID=A0A9D1RYF8_9CORY|nr:Asp23/Gls24 family envelope stress response protein [Candidatus Corynebacterium gallistercoris]
MSETTEEHSPGPAVAAESCELNPKILEPVVRRAALSVPGVITHSSGLNKLTGKDYPRCDIQEDTYSTGSATGALSVDIHVAVHWPSPVTAVAQVVRQTVAQWLIDYTGREVNAVNVEVAAVVADHDHAELRGRRLTIEDLRNHDVHAPLTTPVATPIEPTVDPTPGKATGVAPAHESLRPIPEAEGLPLLAEVCQPAAPTLRRIPTPVGPAMRPVEAPRPAPPVTIPEPKGLPVSHVPTPHEPVLTRIPTPRGLPITIPTGWVSDPQVLPIPPQRGLPILRDIPTPEGLPMRDVPTPEGLEPAITPEAHSTATVTEVHATEVTWESFNRAHNREGEAQ